MRGSLSEPLGFGVAVLKRVRGHCERGLLCSEVSLQLCSSFLALIPLSNEGLGIGGFCSIQKAFVGALTTGGT